MVDATLPEPFDRVNVAFSPGHRFEADNVIGSDADALIAATDGAAPDAAAFTTTAVLTLTLHEGCFAHARYDGSAGPGTVKVKLAVPSDATVIGPLTTWPVVVPATNSNTTGAEVQSPVADTVSDWPTFTVGLSTETIVGLGGYVPPPPVADAVCPPPAANIATAANTMIPNRLRTCASSFQAPFGTFRRFLYAPRHEPLDRREGLSTCPNPGAGLAALPVPGRNRDVQADLHRYGLGRLHGGNPMNTNTIASRSLKHQVLGILTATLVTLSVMGIGTGSANAATIDAQSQSWGRRSYTIYFSRSETNLIASSFGVRTAVAAAKQIKLLPLYLRVGAAGTTSSLLPAVGMVLGANVIPAVATAKAATLKNQCLIAYLSGTSWFVAPFAGFAYAPCSS